MEKENLKNVEEDKYVQYAGDAMRKCMMGVEKTIKHGIFQDFLAAITDYIGCYEKEGATCDAPIFKHFIAVMKAYRGHLEKNRGEYGKMGEREQFRRNICLAARARDYERELKREQRVIPKIM